MRFLVNLRNNGGVIYHRLKKPFELLGKMQGVEVDYFKHVRDIPNKEYDFLVINRSLGYGQDDQDKKFIKFVKKHGTKLIVDIDDYWDLPEYHTIRWRPDLDYEQWRSNILNNLERADYLWTSTEFLKEKLSEKYPNKPIALAKNAIDPDEKQWKESNPILEKKKVPNIGWLGSTTHHRDLDQLRRPFNIINKRFKVELHLTGISKNNDWAGKVSERFYNMFSNNGKNKNITCWRPLSIEEYGLLYNQFDISLGCVRENDFNRGKSELKVIESGVKSLPFVGTDFLTYSRVEHPLRLCRTPNDWVEHLSELIKSRTLRIEEGRTLNSFVLDTYRIEKSNIERLKIL